MATSYVVIADRLDRYAADGKRQKFWRGDKITGLDSEDIDRYLRAGAIAASSTDEATAAAENPVTPPEANPVTTPTPTGIVVPQASEIVPGQNSTPPPAEPKKPPRAATKSVLVQYAVDTNRMTKEEAEAKNLDTLRAELLD